MTTTLEAASYRPIPLQTIRLDSSPDFNLFLRHRGDDGDPRHVLFRSSSLEFGDIHHDRLTENRVTQLFVRESEYRQYARYLERQLGDVLKDRALTLRVRSELLCDVARELLGDGFDDPSSRELLDRASALSSHVVSFALTGDEPLAHLVHALDTTYDLRGHSINVCVYSLAIALRAGIGSRTALRELAMGALFHDIGKTRLPAELLERDDALTADERAEVRRHVELGERLLVQEHKDVPPGVLRPVSLHHEALNGEGYPRRLERGGITPDGRIVAIANTFDSLTTTRPYRARSSAFEALSWMKNDMAGRYDQNLLMCFIRSLSRLSLR